MPRPFLIFPHPEPRRERPRIHPVFLPFAGCPQRCVFCDQGAVTGQPGVRRGADHDLARRHDDLAADLARLAMTHAPPRELAFYGGTFTALPEPWPARFLGLAAEYRARGLVTRVRCSTRPDAVSPRLLADLKARGLDMVELGVQSFDDDALAASGRGHDGKAARWGARMVLNAGLALGIQLMPGLPGDRPGLFAKDVATAAALRPEAARLYPCQVLEGTPLAARWRAGEFRPWPLPRTRQELALGVGALWRAGVQVIRIGLAPEPGLAARVLAGPSHPSLGQMVRSLALYDHIRALAPGLGRAPRGLRYPQRSSGEIGGHSGELARAWERLGIGQPEPWKAGVFMLY
ncbi:MAG: elongator complex protein 3 [Desulfovibrionaceae bacterium]